MEQRSENTFDNSSYLYWKNQISAANAWRDKFVTNGDKIVDKFRDDEEIITRRYNILYSNTETLLPVVYDSAPKAEVIAKDPSNMANRKSAAIIEDALNYFIENKNFNECARAAVMDFLLPGYGVIRPKYKSLIDEQEIELDVETLSEEVVVFEDIDFEYVYWKDFIFPECGNWEHLPWQAFRGYYDYDEAVEQFGEEKADSLIYETFRADGEKDGESTDIGNKKALVYEIWDKKFRQQVFFAETPTGALLDINDDPLELEEFFPVPKVMFSIVTSGTLLPVPFYKTYQDQADELDAINERIYAMIDNMKRRGFYDAAIDELGNLSNMGDNEFWAVRGWAEFQSKGGLNGVMQTEDITSYANILQILFQARQQLLDDIYQIIGISDIRRAQTDPRETLGAQKLKSRYGTIRISTYQRKVAEFMQGLLKITGEIIVKQFQPETLAVITNRPLKTERNAEGKIIEVGVADLIEDLRSKEPADILIGVETDSTILEDLEGDREALRDALLSISEFAQAAPGLIQAMGIPATSKVLMSIIERYKLGREIQQEVQDHVNKLLTEGLPQEESPEQTLAKAQVETKKMDVQLEQQKMQINAILEGEKLKVKQQELMLKAQELGIEGLFKSEKINLEALDKIIKFKGLEVEAKDPSKNVVAGS